MSNVLVTGSTGQLGMCLNEMVKDRGWLFAERQHLDLSKPQSLEQSLEHIDFDILINTAAYTAVDQAEDDSDAAMAINADAPGVLAKLCGDRGAAMVHISTDYVFDGLSPQPYTEIDAVHPLGVYGHSKQCGEDAIRDALHEHIIIRTSWLYSPFGKNFMKTMLQAGSTKPEFNVVFDQTGSPTSAYHLAEAIIKIVDSMDSHDAFSKWGTYHFSNEGVASWFDFAKAIFRESGMPVIVKPVRSSAWPAKVTRPFYSVLDKTKIKDTFGLQPAHWQDALKECLARYNSLVNR